jgi:hypothetical protein
VAAAGTSKLLEFGEPIRQFTQELQKGFETCPKGEVFVDFKHQETPESGFHVQELL